MAAVSIHMKGPLIMIEIGDGLTGAELQQLADTLVELESQFKVTPSRVIDMRTMNQAGVDFSALHSIAERRRSFNPTHPIRTAAVATSPVAIGYARMFQTLMASHPLVTMKLFDDLDAAERWALGQ